MPIQTLLSQLSGGYTWINDLQKLLLAITIEHIDYVHSRCIRFPQKPLCERKGEANRQAGNKFNSVDFTNLKVKLEAMNYGFPL